MEIETKLLILMLVFGIIESLSFSANYLIILFIDPRPISLMSIIYVSLLAIDIAIIIIFAVIYVIGKELDLKIKLNSVVAYLSVGCFLDSLVEYSATMVMPFLKGAALNIGLLGFVLAVVNVILRSLWISLGLFFVSFTALALAYFRVNSKTKQTLH